MRKPGTAASKRGGPATGFTALEFFAGSGLVRVGLNPQFRVVWANDNCPKKAAVYRANHPGRDLHLGAIEALRGDDLPKADLAWASFPCQDLSLAGNLLGMSSGTRSGLFWEWVRVLDELTATKKRPPLLVAENVVGFLVAQNGAHFKEAYKTLRRRGYRAGAVVVDARLFLPQSRPRAFLIAVSEELSLNGFEQAGASEPFHPASVVRAAAAVKDKDWIWWSLPRPATRIASFSEICEADAPCDSITKSKALQRLLSPRNKAKLEAALKLGTFLAGTGYKRTRPDDDGQRLQRLELRFDGIAGCLRTPEGGSSRQIVVIAHNGQLRSRLLTVRECARLMGAPEEYALPGSYNDAYRAMGDAVAVPVTAWITRHLLSPLAMRYRKSRAA